MKKKEFAVGEVFQFGLKKLQVVEDKTILNLHARTVICKKCVIIS